VHRNFSFSPAFDLSVATSPGQTQINARQKRMWGKKPSRRAVHKNCSMSITDQKYIAFRQHLVWYRKQLDYLSPPFPQRTVSKRTKRKADYH